MYLEDLAIMLSAVFGGDILPAINVEEQALHGSTI